MAKADVVIQKAINKLQSEATKSMWKAAVKDARSLNEYARKMAEFLRSAGVPISESDILAAAPVQNWKLFQANVDAYVEEWSRRTIEGFRTKWLTNLARAYGAKI